MFHGNNVFVVFFCSFFELKLFILYYLCMLSSITSKEKCSIYILWCCSCDVNNCSIQNNNEFILSKQPLVPRTELVYASQTCSEVREMSTYIDERHVTPALSFSRWCQIENTI